MERTNEDPSKFIQALPDSARHSLGRLDVLISSVFDGHPRVLWKGVFWGGSNQTIVGYGDLNMRQSRGRVVEWFMVGLALQKNHISVYVNAVEDGQYVVERHRERLGKVNVGKASIGFRNVDDVEMEVFEKILRVARNQLDAKTD